MVRHNNPVTRELVLRIKELLENPRYVNLRLDDIGAIVGTSGTTVSRVKSGHYDYLLEPEQLYTKQVNEPTPAQNEAILEELRSIKDILIEIKEALK